MEFKAFPKIPRVDKLNITITRKYDGTNAQILIGYESCGCWAMNEVDCEGPICVNDNTDLDLGIKAGSRNRWLEPENDNYGFCKWVYDNSQELIAFLGPGRHYGEWCGPGINSGEGFTEKTLVLFDQYRYDRTKLPKNVIIAASISLINLNNLIQGRLDILKTILESTDQLKGNQAGIEGVVINVAGSLFKHVYREEDIPKPKNKSNMAGRISNNLDVSGLLQPVRLYKLLSRDEQYIRDYPNSLKQIVKDYIADLEQENQLSEVDDEKRSQKKALSKVIFPFIRFKIQQKFTLPNNGHSPVTPDNATG